MSQRKRGTTMAVCLIAGGLLSTTIAVGAPDRPSGQAIQFGIGGSFRLESFGDATLAYQRFIWPDVAWRTTIGLNLRYDDGESSVQYDGPNPVAGSQDHTNWDNGVVVTSEWLWYRGAGVAVFFGCGPRVLYSNYRYEDWDYNLNERRWSRDRDRVSQVGVGIQGCLGVQWAAVTWLALHAEYDARAMYLHAVTERDQHWYGTTAPLTERTTTDRLSFQSPGVRFGVSVYF